METKYPKTYRKAIKGAVGGRVLNIRGQEEDFLLVGDPAKADPTQIILEIANAEAEKFFIKNNKPALVNGYLIEITGGVEMSFDETNAVSDGYLKDLLKQPYAKMKKRVEVFTSPVPVDRLLTFAVQDNKPIRTIEFLKAALAKLDNKSVPNIAEIDGVKTSSIG
jgi:hypothetical protein